MRPEVADSPAAVLREAVALPPGLEATSTKRRVNVAVDLRPSSVQHGQHSPLHQNLPATYEPIHVNARARMPYLRAVRSVHRIPASPYARETTSRACSASRV